MLEAKGNLWTYEPKDGYIDARVITTNGYVKKNGEAVMGKGCAKQAAALYPELPTTLGNMLNHSGNHVHLLKQDYLYHDGSPYLLWEVVSFPVKWHWQEKAQYGLISRSCLELVEMANKRKWEHVVLPRPGCGNGNLVWKVVKNMIEPTLDDRFTVIDYA